jgi:hypothetical protein
MNYDVEISTSVAVMQCLLAIGDEKSKESKTIYIYSSGDAGGSFRGCNISSWGNCGVALLP